MKQLLLCSIFLLFSIVIFGQAPQAFSYQAVLRDLTGSVIPNRNISLRISILKDGPTGTQAYQEVHTTVTNEIGLFNLQIGTGSAISGIFEDINWGSSPHFLQIEIDEEGGQNYSLFGTSQLLSVPYALYAESSGNTGNGGEWQKNTSGIEYTEGTVGIGVPKGTALFELNTPADLPILNEFKTLFTATVDDALGDFLAIQNGTTVPNQFIPLISGNHVTDDRTAFALHAYTSPQHDIDNQIALMRFSSRINDNGTQLSVKNRNLFEWTNVLDVKMVMDAEGRLGIGTENPASLLEINGENAPDELIGFKTFFKAVTGNASGDFLAIQNGTTVPNQFIPLISGNHVSDDRTAFAFHAYTSPQYDIANQVAIMRFSSRINDNGSQASVINRNLFEWTNLMEVNMVLDAQGQLGVGTDDPKAQVQISKGDVYIEDINSGIIMRSPNGSCWRITIDNNGAMVPTSITCPN